MEIKVVAISGSLRRDSYTTKLLKAFGTLAPESVQFEMIDVSRLPLLNQDLEGDLPPAVVEFHRAIEGADAVLLGTPEYNRSYSPAIKNALDWGSRPQGQNRWKGKPTGVVGCTLYALGAFGAVHHLRQVLVYLDMHPLQQPEFYLAQAASKFNDAGQLTDESTTKLIRDYWTAYVEFAQRFL